MILFPWFSDLVIWWFGDLGDLGDLGNLVIWVIWVIPVIPVILLDIWWMLITFDWSGYMMDGWMDWHVSCVVVVDMLCDVVLFDFSTKYMIWTLSSSSPPISCCSISINYENGNSQNAIDCTGHSNITNNEFSKFIIISNSRVSHLFQLELDAVGVVMMCI